VNRLQSRFLLAGCLFVAATVGSSLWCAWTLVQLDRVLDRTIRHGQATIDRCAELVQSLEREDDALLLFLSGQVEQAKRDLAGERQRGDRELARLLELLSDSQHRELAFQLREQIEHYRHAGDRLIGNPVGPSDLDQYHRQVNPWLRQAVAGCDRIREANFQSMQQTSVQLRDELARGTRLVMAITLLTVVISIAITSWLARSILLPIRELIASVEQIRLGNFERRVRHSSTDELGQLASGFNRMAESLQEYRQCSLGELVTAKITLETTLNALPDAIFVFGPDGELTASNPPAQRILAATGCTEANRLEQLHLAEEVTAAIRAALAGQPAPARRMDFACALTVVLDGQTRRLLVTAVPVAEFLPGRFGAVVVMDDVTEFARLDELRSELIGVASHELKSPLTALQMNLLMLSELANELPERQRQLIAAAVEGCEELGLTIDELLDMTRIEAGQLRLNLAPVDLQMIFVSVQRSLQTRFSDARVGLVFSVPAEPIGLIADPVRLRSVLANLLTNALKYSPAGGVVAVEVSSGQNTQLGGRPAVQIAVSDQGPGVPLEYRERIFEKFFRVEHYLGQRGKGVRGTGIGLYLCRQIVRSHGGHIYCEPTSSGVGTRFVCIIPVVG